MYLDLDRDQSPRRFAAGDVKIYGSNGNGTDMVAMTLTLNDGWPLVGHVDRRTQCRLHHVTWYATVAEGAPVGNYEFDVSLQGGNTLAEPARSCPSPPRSPRREATGRG